MFHVEHASLFGQEGNRRLAPLKRKFRRVDASGVQSGRSARLEPIRVKAQRPQLVGQGVGRRLPVASAGRCLVPDMNGAAEKGSGGENHALRGDLPVSKRRDSGNPVPVGPKGDRFVLQHRHVRTVLDDGPHPSLVEVLVALDPVRADGRSAPCVQHPELESRIIRVARHFAPQRVDLENEMGFGDAADGGIARHGRNLVPSKGHQERSGAQPCGGQRSLGTGVSASDDDHLECVFV